MRGNPSCNTIVIGVVVEQLAAMVVGVVSYTDGAYMRKMTLLQARGYYTTGA